MFSLLRFAPPHSIDASTDRISDDPLDAFESSNSSTVLRETERSVSVLIKNGVIRRGH